MTSGIKRTYDNLMAPSWETVKAATTIQKATRAFLNRRLNGYKAACESLNEHERPDGGKRSLVYLPKGMPDIVIKLPVYGTREPEGQVQIVHGMRCLLKEQGATHILVPKARAYGKYLIAERLPININNYYNMGLYLNHLSAFDPLVRELTRVHSKKGLRDICTSIDHFLSQVDGTKIRPDNLPFGLNEKQEAVLTLIDLKDLSNDPKPDHFTQLARVFPYHLEIIIEEATRLNLAFDKEAMVRASTNGKEYFKRGYSDFANYLKSKEIAPFALSTDRKRELEAVVEAELLKLNEGINPIFEKLKVGGSPKKGLFTDPALAKELSPKITEAIINKLESTIRKSEKKVETEWELIDNRTLELKRSKLFNPAAEVLRDDPKVDLGGYRESESEYIADQIVIIVLQELVKKGDLFFFDPGFYTYHHKYCWIRY